MAFYDIFLEIKNPKWTKKALIYFNLNIIKYLLRFVKNEEISILEVGPGKGHFYEAVRILDDKILYSAADRNKLILENLKCDSVYFSEAPDLSIFDKKFDIIYASFLVEHLQSGNELFSFISNCKKILKKNGIIVFLAPDCLKQKWEFWNIDYTHAYPTTKRNVSMAFKDNGIDDVDVISFNGLMTYKFFWNKFLTWLAEGILVFYNHKILNFIFYPVHRRRIYELDNVFYKGYCFIKQKNIMFIAKNNLF